MSTYIQILCTLGLLVIWGYDYQKVNTNMSISSIKFMCTQQPLIIHRCYQESWSS